MIKKLSLQYLCFAVSIVTNPICMINQELNKDTLSKLDNIGHNADF